MENDELKRSFLEDCRVPLNCVQRGWLRKSVTVLLIPFIMVFVFILLLLNFIVVLFTGIIEFFVEFYNGISSFFIECWFGEK
mgnify:CR=1 FL=1